MDRRVTAAWADVRLGLLAQDVGELNSSITELQDQTSAVQVVHLWRTAVTSVLQCEVCGAAMT